MRLAAYSKPEPWVEWDKALYRDSKLVDGLDIVTSKPDAFIVEWWQDADYLPKTQDHQVLVYLEQVENFDALVKESRIVGDTVAILSDSKEVLASANSFNIRAFYWEKPTRVPERLWQGFDDSPRMRNGCFSMVANMSRQEDNIPEVIKTFFSMCLYETESGEMLSNYDLEIFSAQDLPVEPFNNIRFNGLQPNPLMFKTIRSSKLFISPYAGDSISTNIIDAIYLGVPVVIKDTETNRFAFDLHVDQYYSDKKELAKTIKRYKEYDDATIDEIAREQLRNLEGRYSPEKSLTRLKEILTGEINESK